MNTYLNSVESAALLCFDGIPQLKNNKSFFPGNSQWGCLITQ